MGRSFKSLKSLESWEKNVAFGATLFVGSGLASMTSRGMGMLSKIPAGARAVRPFPNIRGGYGVFGETGLIIRKRYRIDVLYQSTEKGGLSLFSIREGYMKNLEFMSRDGGNLFRIEHHIHKSPKPYWHYHYRMTKDGVTKGSTKPHKLFGKE